MAKAKKVMKKAKKMPKPKIAKAKQQKAAPKAKPALKKSPKPKPLKKTAVTPKPRKQAQKKPAAKQQANDRALMIPQAPSPPMLKPPAAVLAPPRPILAPPKSPPPETEKKEGAPEAIEPIFPAEHPLPPKPEEPKKPAEAAPKTMAPLPSVPQATPERKPQPPEELPPPKAPVNGLHPIQPAFDMLPDWEDRLRLRRAVFEDGLEFFEAGKGSAESNEAYLMLNQSHKAPHSDLHDYFLICVKDRAGKMVGAIDGHAMGDLLVIGRSCSASPKTREIHILLYAAALAGKNPSYVATYTKLGDFSMDTAGRLILFGRGMGMSAIPLKTSHLVFLRRLGKELDPISNGAEIAGVLERLKVFGELELDAHISEFSSKSVVPLIPLPLSPDSREHLHELRDVVSALAIPAGQLDAVMATLRADYVSGRKDITPAAL